ncbi:MAG: hypothetical protein LBI57_07025 [Helicobacteraceae bacterium]|jgi:hypothetical protein|nr:hypothetical protein [Helicobacteraceae bacterium]
MSVKPAVLTDEQVPQYITKATTRNIVKRYGTLKFWSAARGYPYWAVRQLIGQAKLKGTRRGGKVREIRDALIAEGLWAETESAAKVVG